MTRLQSLYHLSIATALLARITEDNNGLYKQATTDIYAICDKEVLQISNSYVKKLDVYKKHVNDYLGEVKDVDVIVQLILDNLSAVIVAWSEIDNDKYVEYVKTLQRHINQLAYYWRGMLEYESQDKAFEITDNVMNKLFKREIV